MSGLMHLVIDNYNEIVEARKDPSVDSWLFMHSPVPVVFILATYLYFVLKLGPKLMAKREAFQLRMPLIIYNAYQVAFSIWFCVIILRTNAFSYIFQKSCDQGPPPELKAEFSRGAWWWFMSKIVELLDTVFFVLRKKNTQISFLHVYHHTITAFFAWGYLKFLPGEQGVFLGFLNSFVHIVMYTYYLIAALGPKYQKYLWWKKYMTTIQLGQFCVMLAYLTFIIVMDCKVPKALTIFFVVNVVIFLFLFSDFYSKAYKTPKKEVQHTNGTLTGKTIKVP